MLRILSTIVDICLLRRGPQDLPRGQATAAALLVIYLLTYGFARWKIDGGGDLIWPGIVSAGLLVAIAAGLLQFVGHRERLAQTVSALASTSALLTLVALPMTLSLMADIDAKRDANAVIAFCLLSLFVWSLAIDAHIFRNALSSNYTVGALVSVSCFAAGLILRDMLLGHPT